jgi:excinuclease UvrABC nuclease subunit
VAEVSELGALMDEASDHEDYERAAELFEAITASNAQLEQVIGPLALYILGQL